ncbi:MAG: hypothetical protein ACREQO_04015 [Candidatus Binatia bacterium]
MIAQSSVKKGWGPRTTVRSQLSIFNRRCSLGLPILTRQTIINNNVEILKAARVFDVPVVLSTVERKFQRQHVAAGPGDLSNQTPIEHSSMNSWDGQNFVAPPCALPRSSTSLRSTAYPASSGGTESASKSRGIEKRIRAADAILIVTPEYNVRESARSAALFLPAGLRG